MLGQVAGGVVLLLVSSAWHKLWLCRGSARHEPCVRMPDMCARHGSRCCQIWGSPSLLTSIGLQLLDARHLWTVLL